MSKSDIVTVAQIIATLFVALAVAGGLQPLFRRARVQDRQSRRRHAYANWPADYGVDADGRGESEGGEQAADLVADSGIRPFSLAAGLPFHPLGRTGQEKLGVEFIAMLRVDQSS